MVAQTEQDEEDEDASHKDAEQNIKELKHQVHRGFRTIQKSIAQQEQVILEQSNGSVTEDKDFNEAVKTMVDQKLKEREAGYEKQLAEMKAQQDEMMALLRASMQRGESQDDDQ